MGDGLGGVAMVLVLVLVCQEANYKLSEESGLSRPLLVLAD